VEYFFHYANLLSSLPDRCRTTEPNCPARSINILALFSFINGPRLKPRCTDHFRQTGVTPQLSIIYLLLRSRIFIFGGLVMNSTIPVDLLELKTQFETWRTKRDTKDQPQVKPICCKHTENPLLKPSGCYQQPYRRSFTRSRMP
jgi:hypothetical protein